MSGVRVGKEGIIVRERGVNLARNATSWEEHVRTKTETKKKKGGTIEETVRR